MLSDKIWITRKVRIYTEGRLQRYNNISQLLMTLYSLALVSLSIWNLQNNDAKLNLFAKTMQEFKIKLRWSKEDIVKEFFKLIPNFEYEDKKKYLDGKM